MITYGALTSAHAKGKQPKQAREVFQATRQRGVMPNIIIHSTLLSACEKGKHPQQALEAFQATRQQGVMPNTISKDLPILSRSCSGQWATVLALLHDFIARGSGSKKK